MRMECMNGTLNKFRGSKEHLVSLILIYTIICGSEFVDQMNFNVDSEFWVRVTYGIFVFLFQYVKFPHLFSRD